MYQDYISPGDWETISVHNEARFEGLGFVRVISGDEYCIKRIIDWDYLSLEISVLQNDHCRIAIIRDESTEATYQAIFSDYLPSTSGVWDWDSLVLLGLSKLKYKLTEDMIGFTRNIEEGYQDNPEEESDN